MIELWPGVVLLLALASLFLLNPRWFLRSQQDRSLRAANLAWFSQRRRELEGEVESTQLLDDARLRLLEDGIDAAVETSAEPRSWRAWLLLAPLLLISLLLYWQLGAAPDVLLTRTVGPPKKKSSAVITTPSSPPLSFKRN